MATTRCSQCEKDDPEITEDGDTACCHEGTLVVCPECGEDQADMGGNIACESCQHYPMPYVNYEGKVVDGG